MKTQFLILSLAFENENYGRRWGGAGGRGVQNNLYQNKQRRIFFFVYFFINNFLKIKFLNVFVKEI